MSNAPWTRAAAVKTNLLRKWCQERKAVGTEIGPQKSAVKAVPGIKEVENTHKYNIKNQKLKIKYANKKFCVSCLSS
jgi:hypothetical protein